MESFFFWLLYFCSGMSMFFILSKFKFNRKNGYPPNLPLVLFPACVIFWPIFGVLAAIIRE